jgi:hypothetical protein
VGRAGLVMRELLNILYPRHVRVPNTPDGCQIETAAAARLSSKLAHSPLFAFEPLAVRCLGSDILVGFQVTPTSQGSNIYDMTTISDMDHSHISESDSSKPLHQDQVPLQ